MVENKYYYVTDTDYKGFMIGKCLGNIYQDLISSRSNAILISTLDNNNEFSKEVWCFKTDTRSYRLATSNEIQWLNECIKQDKFIPFNEIKLNIEIW